MTHYSGRNRFLAYLCVAITAACQERLFFCSDEEETPKYWLDLGKEELDAALKLENLNKNVAKNIIIFLGE